MGLISPIFSTILKVVKLNYKIKGFIGYNDFLISFSITVMDLFASITVHLSIKAKKGHQKNIDKNFTNH